MLSLNGTITTATTPKLNPTALHLLEQQAVQTLLAAARAGGGSTQTLVRTSWTALGSTSAGGTRSCPTSLRLLATMWWTWRLATPNSTWVEDCHLKCVLVRVPLYP